MEGQRDDVRVAGGVADRFSADEDVICAVVEAVAAVKGIDPLELTPLYEAVDPDALESFRARMDGADRSTAGGVVFEWNDCLVEVPFSGDVRARPVTPCTWNPFVDAA